MKLSEIRETSTAELQAEIVKLKREIFAIKFQVASGDMEDSSKVRNLRKTIARILTVIREREISGN